MNPEFAAYLRILEGNRRYGHTLWIDPRGNIIDLTGKPLTHYSWLAKKFNQTENTVWAFAAKNGWIQVRNHAVAISISGPKKFIKKNKKAIFDIIDNRLFAGSVYDLDGDEDSFLVDFTWIDNDGDPAGKRITFKIPKDDSKVRRFL